MGRGTRLLPWLRRHVFALYYAVVAVVAVLSYLQPAPVGLSSGGVSPAVLGELRGVSSYVYEPDGQRQYQSESALVKYLSDGDTLTLEPLTMRYYSDGKQTMLLQSEFGKMLDKGQRVELSGVVELEQLTQEDGLRKTVHTRDVEMNIDQEIAVTQEVVTIRRGGETTSGRGMIADLKRGGIRLLNEVKVSREL